MKSERVLYFLEVRPWQQQKHIIPEYWLLLSVQIHQSLTYISTSLQDVSKELISGACLLAALWPRNRAVSENIQILNHSMRRTACINKCLRCGQRSCENVLLISYLTVGMQFEFASNDIRRLRQADSLNRLLIMSSNISSDCRFNTMFNKVIRFLSIAMFFCKPVVCI